MLAGMGWIGLAGALWLAALLRLSAGRPPEIETPPDALPPQPVEDEMQTARAADRFAYRAPVAPERSRAVTGRRSTPGTGEANVSRLARRAEEDRQAVQVGFDAVLESLDSIRSEVRKGAQDNGRLSQRLSDLEFQVNLTRDEVQRSQSSAAPGRVAATKTALKEFANGTGGKIAKWFGIIVSGLVIANNIPDAQRVMEKVWTFVRTLDEPAPAKVDDKH